MPTRAQKQGVFSTRVTDPASGQPFPDNAIPPTLFDSVSRQVLLRYPDPNLPGAANNYVRTVVKPESLDQFDARIDRYFAFNTAGTGNSLASLLLGQVDAFGIDIQAQALQERAHIAEFFAGDEWKIPTGSR